MEADDTAYGVLKCRRLWNAAGAFLPHVKLAESAVRFPCFRHERSMLDGSKRAEFCQFPGTSEFIVSVTRCRDGSMPYQSKFNQNTRGLLLCPCYEDVGRLWQKSGPQVRVNSASEGHQRDSGGVIETQGQDKKSLHKSSTIADVIIPTTACPGSLIQFLGACSGKVRCTHELCDASVEDSRVGGYSRDLGGGCGRRRRCRSLSLGGLCCAGTVAGEAWKGSNCQGKALKRKGDAVRLLAEAPWRKPAARAETHGTTLASW